MLRTIRQKVIVFAVTMAVFSLVQAVAVFYQSETISHDAHFISEQALPGMRLVHDMRTSVIQVQQWLTDISATRGRDGLDDGFEKAREQAEAFRRLAAELAAIEPAKKPRIDQLVAIFEEYYRAGQQMAHAYVDEGVEAGNVMMGQFDETAERLSQSLEPLLADVQASTEAMLETQEKDAGMMELMIVVFTAGTLLLVGLLVMGAFHQVLRPLCNVVNALRDIAEGEGDLTRRLSANTASELGELAHWFNLFTEKLQAIVRDIGTAVTELTRQAEAMAQSADRTNAQIRLQHSETDQVATAMNEMSATVSEVAGHAVNAASSAEEADHQAGQGRQVVGSAVASINNLAREVEKASEVIQNLETTSENIGQVLDVIKAIAEQTNLLAFTAAIEAARAGEQGRGFAVVADEVRTLAQRTQDSTAEIQTIIENLQEEARNAVKVMEEGRNQAHASVDQAGRAGEALEAITQAVAKINDMNTQIASAAEEQSAVAEEINKNIVTISGVASETAEGARSTALGSQQISGLAGQLEELVARFKV